MSDWFNVRFDQQNVKTNFWVWIYRPATFSHDMGGGFDLMGAILLKSRFLRALLLYHIKGHEQDGRGRKVIWQWLAGREGGKCKYEGSRRANATNQGIFEAGLQAGGRPVQGSPCNNSFKPQRLEAGGGGGGGEVVGLHHLEIICFFFVVFIVVVNES